MYTFPIRYVHSKVAVRDISPPCESRARESFIPVIGVVLWLLQSDWSTRIRLMTLVSLYVHVYGRMFWYWIYLLYDTFRYCSSESRAEIPEIFLHLPVTGPVTRCNSSHRFWPNHCKTTMEYKTRLLKHCCKQRCLHEVDEGNVAKFFNAYFTYCPASGAFAVRFLYSFIHNILLIVLGPKINVDAL